MKMEYILKHKNVDVLSFYMDNDTFNVSDIGTLYNKERLPFNIGENASFVEYGIQLNTWIKSRGLSGSRKDLNNIKKIFNVKDAHTLTVNSLGLNLTDHYWLHKAENNIKWEDVNYFDNTFDELKQSGNYEPIIDNSVNNSSPNFCVDGSIEKRWVIKNDARVLLKGSRFKIMQEPFNEKIVSMIFDEFGINHVNYDQLMTKNKIPYSECKTMSNKDIEFINAQWVINVKPQGVNELLNHYINMCKENGIMGCKKDIDAMLAIDFIIGNEDRHRGNFGILRNANNLKWLGIAPIFDNGNCLFYDKDNESIKDFGIDTMGKAFGDSNRLQINAIDYPEWYTNIKGKHVIDVVAQGLKGNEHLRSDRIDKVVNIVAQRLNIFETVISKIKSYNRSD